jgi:hypothetical protein
MTEQLREGVVLKKTVTLAGEVECDEVCAVAGKATPRQGEPRDVQDDQGASREHEDAALWQRRSRLSWG